jgi:broad specificity phosphatase PhoE
MSRLLWVRHGENEANLTRTLSFKTYDRDLTDRGRQQARGLAESLAGSVTVTGIACSPLSRARQTAEIIAARLQLPLTGEFEDLREVNVGSLDGRSDDEAWSVYTKILEAWRAGDASVRFPGGEDLHELTGRLRGVMLALAAPGAAGDVVIVAHGASIRAALPAITGTPDPGADLRTGGYAVFNVQPGTPPGGSIELVSWPAVS